jgi:serine/tyrosine/threonine adenylyltransferase
LVTDDWLLRHFEDAYYDPAKVNSDVLLQKKEWMRSYLIRLLRDRQSDAKRSAQMDAINPLYVLRNYIAQQAIDLAEQGDYSEIARVLQLLRNPYQTQTGMEAYAMKRPEWARHKAGCSTLSCSS